MLIFFKKRKNQNILYFNSIDELNYKLKAIAKALQIDFGFPYNEKNMMLDDEIIFAITYTIILEMEILIRSEDKRIFNYLQKLESKRNSGKYREYFKNRFLKGENDEKA
ncbi:hypothetical protein HMPREF3224_00484 [Anaerococcus hydrogenalis]|nr:hypothetical protein HMPREF3224_00484 [Anaerococcus hydrogenalis]